LELILISAMTRDRVIGNNNALPWNIPQEYASFLAHVRGHPIIMGRTSFEIFGPDLTESKLFVVSRTIGAMSGACACSDIESAVKRAGEYGDRVFSAGGASIYRQTLPMADAMYLSIIKKDYQGDTYFPEFDDVDDWALESSQDHTAFELRIYRRQRVH
jgi:dihydrofolate reductase